jgi:hypothetical protein
MPSNTPIFSGASTSNPNQATRPVFLIDRNGVQTQILSGPGSCTGYGCIGATEQNFPRQLQLLLKFLF